MIVTCRSRLIADFCLCPLCICILKSCTGRLPIRVELKGLTEEDMYRILTEPITNLIMQQVRRGATLYLCVFVSFTACFTHRVILSFFLGQVALLATENVRLEVTDGAIREIARVAALVNKTVENIGARRLHTVLERIVEEISFSASDHEEGSTIVVDEALVQSRVNDMLVQSDTSKYIL